MAKIVLGETLSHTAHCGLGALLFVCCVTFSAFSSVP